MRRLAFVTRHFLHLLPVRFCIQTNETADSSEYRVKSEDKMTSGAPSRLYIFLKKNLKICLVCFVSTTTAWSAGYLNFSFAWIMVALTIYAIWDFKEANRKQQRSHLQKTAQPSYVSKIEDLPSWVYFSEYESASWLNEVLRHMWPFIESMAQTILKENVEQEMQKSLPKALQTLYFEKIALGRKAPIISNVKTYECASSKKRDEFIMDANIIYEGDAQLKLAVKNVKLGISDIQLSGTIRIIFKPLLSNYNPIGGITLFFLNRPKISFNLTNLLNILDIPGLKPMLRNIIGDVISSFIVLPNRIAVPLVDGVDGSDLQYPVPEGVLRIEIIEARELMATDFVLIPVSGKAADPYAIVEVGAQKFRTKVRKGDQNPEWNEIFDAFVDNAEGQQLEVHIFDQDISKDTHMGRVATGIASAIQQGPRDVWLPLEGVKQGKLHMRMHWLSLSNTSSDLSQPSNGKNVAVLIVKVIKAANLPGNLKPRETRSLFCKVSVDDVTIETFQIVGRTEVEWKQAVRFLLTVPKLQKVQVEVVESKGKKTLGVTKFPICYLVDEPDMSQEKEFQLMESGPESTLTCRLTLRALKYGDIDQQDSARPKDSQPNKKQPSKNNRRNKNSNAVGGLKQKCPQKMAIPKVVVNDADSIDGVLCSSGSSAAGSYYDSNSRDTSAQNLTSRGQVQLTLKYNHIKNRLLVNVERAYGLVSRDAASKTNPYARVYLLPDRSKRTRRQTAAFGGTLDPNFNARFEYVIGLDQLRDRQLEVAIKHNRIGLPTRGKNIIGYAVISLDDVNLTDGVTLCCDLRKYSGKSSFQRRRSFTR